MGEVIKFPIKKTKEQKEQEEQETDGYIEELWIVQMNQREEIFTDTYLHPDCKVISTIVKLTQ